MRILMVAPEPVFTPRGTPFSVAFRLKAYSELGHQVDLATYPFGSNLRFPGLRTFRTSRVPGVRAVKVGPSLAKLPLDALLFGMASTLVARGSYDLLHTHEEAGFWGTFATGVRSLPHLYDMHSSLPQQLRNFHFGENALLIALFEALERITLRRASAVIAICRDLYERVRAIAPATPVALIENVLDPSLIDENSSSGTAEVPSIRKNGFTALYAGTFEPYQGIDLMLAATRRVVREKSDFRLVMAGGTAEQIRQAERMASELGVRDRVQFLGAKSPAVVSKLMRQADVLITARTSGTNTPLKIYSYLASGTPIVATDIYSHRQVLNEEVAVLVEPSAEGLADGIARLARDAALRRRLSQRAKEYYRQRYSYERYLQQVEAILKAALRKSRREGV